MLSKKQEAIDQTQLIIDMIKLRLRACAFYDNYDISPISLRADLVHLEMLKELIENV